MDVQRSDGQAGSLYSTRVGLPIGARPRAHMLEPCQSACSRRKARGVQKLASASLVASVGRIPPCTLRCSVRSQRITYPQTDTHTHTDRDTHTQTDGRTDGRTDRQTDLEAQQRCFPYRAIFVAIVYRKTLSCFFVFFWGGGGAGIAQLLSDTLQHGVSHRCACVKLSAKGGGIEPHFGGVSQR